MSSEQEFKCVFCSETFSQKEDLQIHFRKHADPNFNQKKPKGRSQDEADMSAEKPKDQMEVVECDVCPEVFTTISKAITHKHKMHPDHDTKYFCPWCGKLFTMKHLYKKHMQATHLDKIGSEEQLFHCDSCDVDFNLPGAMIYHNKFYHRQDDLPILGHSKKLKMILEELVQIYYCPFCGEEHDNKVNLHKHINEDHSSEDQSPSDVFRCPLCDAIFYYLDAYELHLTFHSNEDLYTERNTLMDEITDFSLETVQPLQEKVETVEPNNEGTAMGIEELLELTMDSTDRKSKKHKKHKKSKKSAITLDEFLNMNKDVFGEGIDFQGVEEVPTQAIAKRFKTKKAVPASHFTSPDLVKLKRQGIVVKKQQTKAGKLLMRNNVVMKAVMNSQKNITPQKNALTSTDAVLSKLLNQGSQIKIVKKSNQDSDEPLERKEDNKEKENPSNDSIKEKNDEVKNVQSDVTDPVGNNVKSGLENVYSESREFNDVKFNSVAASPQPESPSLISDNKDLEALHNSDEDSNHSTKCKDNMFENTDEPENAIKLTDNLTALKNNSNITLKLPKQNILTTKENNQEMNDGTIKIKEVNVQENAEKNTSVSASENTSLNALKHLSHLITIKSVNSSKAIPLPPNNKPEISPQKAETTKVSSNIQPNLNNSTNKTAINHLSNFRNLDGLTIKPTNQSNANSSKNDQSVESKYNYNEDNETDEETPLHAERIEGNKIDTELAPIVKTPQLNVQTKHSPKTIQKESPKGLLNNDHNSQSSADLLKHLKNVTAKPVNLNSLKIPTPQCSPSAVKRSIPNKTSVQKQICEDGTEIFSIDDSDSDEGTCATSNIVNKTENKMETNKSVTALKNANKNIETNKSVIAPKNTNKNVATKLINQHSETFISKNIEKCSNKAINDEDDWDNEFDEKEPFTNEPNTKFCSPKANQKNVAINNVLKNLSRNITVKSRNSSPSFSVKSQDHNSRDSHLDTNEADSDSDTPLSRVKITEMDNMSGDELPEEHAEKDNLEENVKIEHPDDSLSDHDDEPMDEELDDIESQIATSRVQKVNTWPSSNLDSLKNLSNKCTIKSTNNKSIPNKQETSSTDEIPSFAKNFSNQISIKQIKKPENKSAEEAVTRSTNQASMHQKMASSSNQVNSFNKEVKTVKTFQTQTKTVIQEITTTVTKTVKTVNQTTKQEVRNMAQSSSVPMITQKIQGLNTTLGQKNYQGMKVRQSTPCVRPKIRGQAPQTVRPAICAPPPVVRPPSSTPVRPPSSTPVRPNQVVPVRPALNRPSGPRSRMPNVMNMRPSTSGHQRPSTSGQQITRPVKVSPRAVFAPPKNTETPGHFSCFKKPKESLFPEPDFSTLNKTDEDSSVQFSSSMQMSKSNFSSTSKMVKGNSVVTSTQMKSEMSASSQQLSKLRGMSGLVVKTSQSQAKQTQVEEKCEMSASKRNALEAIQKLQSQGLLVKKPRLDVSEDSDHSQHGSDDMGHDFNEEFDE